MSVPAAPTLPPLPAAGSSAWFVVLYGGAQRERLRCLFALADEIAASLDVKLDHQVAHLRLAWWREEGERLAQGQARHPWTRALHETPLDLLALAAATELELARAALPTETAAGIPPEPFERALFLACAQALHAEPLSAAVTQTVRAMAERLAQPAAHTEPAAATALAASDQRQLAPLLVWAALAEQRGLAHEALPATRSQLLRDNLRAWRTARAAARGRFQARNR